MTTESASEGSGNVQVNPLKEAYFGETHLHTSASMDAYIGGNRVSTEEAYRFARGEEVMINGSPMKLKRPLDFAAISDHAEYLGETYTLMNPGTPGYDDPIATQMREVDNLEDGLALFVKYVVTPNRTGSKPHPDFWQGVESVKSQWRKNFEATEKFNDPGKFTTIHAYEWSSAPKAGNLHRNVLFRDTVVPEVPFSAVEGRDPQQLWEWMKEQKAKGSKLFAIPHNSNGSKGLMFPDKDLSGNPVDADYIRTRNEMEPLIEMMQIKGNSEVYPKFWPNDEFANFETAESIQNYSDRTFEERNFVRYGLKRGLKYQEDFTMNPFKYGFAGGTDNHNGAPSNVEEDNYSVGSHGLADQTAEARVNNAIDGWATAYDINPGALTGVWADSNTRGAIWDAMKNKETFTTSGPRIKVRMFAGYGLADRYDSYQGMVEAGLANATPMGGDLPVSSGDAPKIMVWAQKDPIGPNLDRIQIIKGWVENGKMMEKIYNVALSDNRSVQADGSVEPLDAPVNMETGAFTTDKGAPELTAVWEDPDFNPAQQAFYYTRVIQLPTARWTLWDEIREGVTFPESVARTLQERAWGSPVWYTPN
ncbi:DUF3604 domain-containing protein [Robiginitalea aurantiaca]|uniref:DUF3604 domain-containing protein n=1 Tax=Robiginitalea aurantiaca TaxID=3056915 RepID=A0ABT7WB31_9FLAO|nr:DUF3604 domain-containing protein [Robiginitalea aurantiaca]MDM9630123.1 DUF3604 domain-containing protein [Robiginitalea aurantiaca]